MKIKTLKMLFVVIQYCKYHMDIHSNSD